MKIVLSNFTVKMLFPGYVGLDLIEEAGRTCYKSSINGASGISSAYDFIKRHAIEGGHESMLEHVSVSVLVVCDLGVSQEWTRHRLVRVDDDFMFDMEWNPGVSAESSRFCNYSKEKFGSNISVIDIRSHLKNPESAEVWLSACAFAEKSYFRMLELGESPQIARSVLNRSTKTEMFLTANLREWRRFFRLRAVGESGKPHPQMLEITIPMLKKFKELIPVVFDDIEI